MKIIFINRFFYPDHSATSQILSDLAFFLAAQNYQVCVISSRLCYDNPVIQLPITEEVQSVLVQRVWSTRFGRYALLGRVVDYLSFYLSVMVSIFRWVKADDIVVVKTDPPLLSIAIAGLIRWRRAKLVNWLQDLFPEIAIALKVKGFNGYFARWLSYLRNKTLHMAEANVVLGKKMQSTLLAKGIKPDTLHIIPNWADGSTIRPLLAEHSTLREAWGLTGKFIIGYSGNLGRAHEIDTLLGAINALKNNQHIVFVLIGGGLQMQKAQQYCQQKGFSNTKFLPYQPREQLMQSLSVADLQLVILRPEMEGCIVPSKFYGIAAAGRGTLFIGDQQGEIANIINQYHAGKVIKTGDIEGLKTAILELSQHPHDVQQMGNNARICFDQNYDIQLAMLAWTKLLEHIKQAGKKNDKCVR